MMYVKRSTVPDRKQMYNIYSPTYKYLCPEPYGNLQPEKYEVCTY